jgi:hypothetical protein
MNTGFVLLSAIIPPQLTFISADKMLGAPMYF